MNFQEAIQKIEERGFFNRYAEVKPIFDARLEELDDTDYAEQGLCYYYLLVSYLKAHLVHETEEARRYYEQMDEAFEAQLKIYQQKLKSPEAKIYRSEIVDFFTLVERCYNSLVLLYEQKGFQVMQAAYRRKMQFKKAAHRFRGHRGKWLFYNLLEWSSGYGTNLVRWAMTIFFFAIAISFGFYLIDLFVDDSLRTLPEGTHPFTYFYFASTTLTSVGYGDIVPHSLPGQILAVIESFLGFLMLGTFIGMIKLRVV